MDETYVAPPEESLREALDLLAELGRTSADARHGLIRHQKLTDACLKVLPAIVGRIRSALAEITAGEGLS